jgi:hypothetical protein
MSEFGWRSLGLIVKRGGNAKILLFILCLGLNEVVLKRAFAAVVKLANRLKFIKY